MKRTTNAQVAAALRDAAYLSNFTGQEVDRGVETSLRIRPYIETHVKPPYVPFTGDRETVLIGAFEETVWLHSIVLNCVRAFSKSAPNYSYWLELVDNTNGGVRSRILPEDIPTEVMMTEGLSVEYTVDRWLPVNCRIEMVGSSTNAFGQVDVKLLLV